MSIKSGKRLEARAARLLEERKVLRSKTSAARRAIRSKTDTEITKTVRAFFAGAEKNPAGLCEKLAEIFATEKENLNQISLSKTTRKNS
ncbi:MAG: hypothetical protein A2Y12_16295 [Planctomycetes bacterium GWF2_42_9]|nr:MAG: hypothetical protein A2Y12_16295 [Planctomycetes bacterium GWF2_42_9]